MDWKSTTIISGAGVLATWFFSMPPAQKTVVVPTAPPARAERATSGAIDIQQEAERLQSRAPTEQTYSTPSRNPFRFTEPRAVEHAPAPPPSLAAPVAAPLLAPAPPQIALDGIASDTIDGVMQRTAILATGNGVVIAKEGDQVDGYRVVRVAPDSVELTTLSDGSSVRLALH